MLKLFFLFVDYIDFKSNPYFNIWRSIAISIRFKLSIVLNIIDWEQRRLCCLKSWAKNVLEHLKTITFSSSSSLRICVWSFLVSSSIIICFLFNFYYKYMWILLLAHSLKFRLKKKKKESRKVMVFGFWVECGGENARISFLNGVKKITYKGTRFSIVGIRRGF